MRRLLMRQHRLIVFIGFVDKKAGFHLGILQDIKAQVARLLQRAFVVGAKHLKKLIHPLGFNIDLHQRHIHFSSPCFSSCQN